MMHSSRAHVGGKPIRLLLIAAAAALPHAASAQSIPPAPAVSSVQVIACTVKAPTEVDYCGWGVWGMDTQRSTLIADLKEAATYVICRDPAPPEETTGFPLAIEVDGQPLAGGTPNSPFTWSQTSCAVATGKKIAVSSPRAPAKPIRGYYIRSGNRILGNALAWSIRKGGGFAPERALLGQLATSQVARVCFGDYVEVVGPARVREHKLLVDGTNVQVRNGEVAVFPYSSCVDINGRSVVVEPLWTAGGASVAYGRFAF